MELSAINSPGTNMAGDVSGSREVTTDIKTLSQFSSANVYQEYTSFQERDEENKVPIFEWLTVS